MAIKTTKSDGTVTIEFVGAVISEREMNGYDDSDFYVTVEDTNEAGEYIYREIMVGTTRGSMPVHAWVDATPEVLARHKAHQAKIAARARAAKADVDAHMPERGKIAVVDGGRKHKGKSGRIFWVGADEGYARTHRYGDYGSASMRSMAHGFGIWIIANDCRDSAKRVGIETFAGEKIFVSAQYVDAFIDPADDVSDEEMNDLVADRVEAVRAALTSHGATAAEVEYFLGSKLAKNVPAERIDMYTIELLRAHIERSTLAAKLDASTDPVSAEWAEGLRKEEPVVKRRWDGNKETATRLAV